MSSVQSLPSQYIPFLRATAIAGSLWNAGSMTTAYRLLPSTYPAVQTSRKLATKQWEFYYWALSATVPPTDLATILICSGLAYVEHKENPSALAWKLWATAAGIMPIGWVWVWTVMKVPSDKLLQVANPEGEDAKPGLDTEPDLQRKAMELLKEFNSQMGVRMMFPWIVGGLALWASLGQ